MSPAIDIHTPPRESSNSRKTYPRAAGAQVGPITAGAACNAFKVGA